MESGAVSGVEPVTRIERQEIDFGPLREVRRLVYHESTIVNASFESHPGRIPYIPPDATITSEGSGAWSVYRDSAYESGSDVAMRNSQAVHPRSDLGGYGGGYPARGDRG